MSLRAKIILALVGVVALFIAVNAAAQRWIVARTFDGLERESTVDGLEELVAFLEAELAALERSGLELALLVAHDLRPPPAQAPGEQAPEVDIFLVGDATGRVLWSRAGGLRGEGGAGAPSAEALEPLLHAAAKEALAPGACGGVHLTERGPLLVGSRPLASAGDTALWILYGRFLGEELLQAAGERVGLAVTLCPPGAPEVPSGVRERLRSRPERPVLADGPEGRELYAQLPVLGSLPPLVARATAERGMARARDRALRTALLSSISASSLILFVLVPLLKRIVLRPIARLTEHAQQIGLSEDTSIRLDMRRRDEIGSLSREFDRMVEKLEHSRRANVETARLAGMSEISTGILHNVGNTMNSVNVTAKEVARRLNRLGNDDLEVVLGELEAHAGHLDDYLRDDPQGKHLMPFLSQITFRLSERKADLLHEVHSLTLGLDRIIELIASQREFARRGGLSEWISISALVDEALELARGARKSSARVEVERRFEELPRAVLDAHRLRGILVNLLLNAFDSVQRRPGAGRIVIAVHRDGERLVLEVADDGVGIAAGDLSRIFQQGFTTKRRGHGLGLHVSAVAAEELRGTLSAKSAGPGRGASFRLEIPFRGARFAVAG